MKKLSTFLLTTAILGGFMLAGSSCTREFTCQCTMTYEGSPGLPDSAVRQYTIQDTKKNAKDMCEGNSRVYQEGTIITHEDCALW